MTTACLAAVAVCARGDDAPGRIVHIDLQATDARGRAVADLTTADFELAEEGVAKPLESATFRRAGADSDGGRAFAIFLDEYHVESGEPSRRVRDAIAQFVDREVGPRDLLCVMKPLDSLFAIRLTRDRDAAREAIRTFEGRSGDYEARNAYERNFMAATPPRIDAARNQIAWSAINALAAHLGSLGDGRKTLIVASEGAGVGERRRGQEYQATRDMVLRTANRGNIAIYALDPRVPAETAGEAANIHTLATETDGAIIAGDLEAGLRRAAADSNAYYLLAFRTTRPDDGRFHEVQVRVKRAGVGVRARKGFVAASPDEAFRTELLAKLNEPKRPVPLEPAVHVSTLIRPWFGLSRGADGRTRVTFVWEPASSVPGDRRRRQPARLVLTALAPAGEVLFDGVVKPTGPAAIDEPGVTSARAVFDVKPGRLRLRMSIQDAASQVLDQDIRELSIRDLAGAVVVGTPEVLRARNAREFRTLDAAAVPVASREFSRTERLLIRFQAYGPSGATSVSAKLLGRLGQPIRDLTVTEPVAPQEGAHAIDLSLAGLAAGEYMIEIVATAPSGGAKDRIGFRVTS